MTLSLRPTLRAGIIPVLALCLGLLPACGGGVGGSDLIIPEGCVVTEADLRGTWIISHVAASLECPAGSPLQAIAKDSSFTPVTVARDETLPGFTITAAGLTATVEDINCHIIWTYLDEGTDEQYQCFTTFHPESRTAGGTAEAGHCSQVTLLDAAGAPVASCTIPSPYLDTYIVVEGS